MFKNILVILSLLRLASSQYPLVQVTFFGNLIDNTVSFPYGAKNALRFLILSKTYYDDSKETVIYIQNWSENPSSECASSITAAFLKRKSEYNVAIVDWSSLSRNPNLLMVLFELDNVALSAHQIMTELQGAGLNLQKIHLIGFGFGAIIAGTVGRLFRDRNSILLPRITGLDVGSFFGITNLRLRPRGLRCHLGKDDAQFVDVIHTNAGAMGDSEFCGHAEFWPNGGRSQFGCKPTKLSHFYNMSKEFLNFYQTEPNFGDLFVENIDNFASFSCSHMQSCRYFTESVTRPPQAVPFLSSRCQTFLGGVVSSACTASPRVSMGLYAKETTVADRLSGKTAIYYTLTNFMPPFSKN
jgi:hypothetical protein